MRVHRAVAITHNRVRTGFVKRAAALCIRIMRWLQASCCIGETSLPSARDKPAWTHAAHSKMHLQPWFSPVSFRPAVGAAAACCGRRSAMRETTIPRIEGSDEVSALLD
jgi:hypothetical protein